MVRQLPLLTDTEKYQHQYFLRRQTMPAVDTVELKSMFESDEEFLLINTLDPQHFDDTKLPTAINIAQSNDSFVSEVERRAGSKDKKIIVYCASIDCDSSTQAAKKLDDAGFTKVYDFRGGFKAWQQHDANQISRSTGGS
jgi:rhodanese-related sulfurtransferase